MKIFFDPDIPKEYHDQIEQIIKEQIKKPCACGCNEIYVSFFNNILDVKCYDCGESFFEMEIEFEEEG